MVNVLLYNTFNVVYRSSFRGGSELFDFTISYIAATALIMLGYILVAYLVLSLVYSRTYLIK